MTKESFTKCQKCGAKAVAPDFDKDTMTCSSCGYDQKVELTKVWTAKERLSKIRTKSSEALSTLESEELSAAKLKNVYQRLRDINILTCGDADFLNNNKDHFGNN